MLSVLVLDTYEAINDNSCGSPRSIYALKPQSTHGVRGNFNFRNFKLARICPNFFGFQATRITMVNSLVSCTGLREQRVCLGAGSRNGMFFSSS